MTNENQDFLSGLDTKIRDYINKLVSEKESLGAKFMAENNLKPSEVCIVERPTKDHVGRVFYYEKKESEISVSVPIEWPWKNGRPIKKE